MNILAIISGDGEDTNLHRHVSHQIKKKLKKMFEQNHTLTIAAFLMRDVAKQVFISLGNSIITLI